MCLTRFSIIVQEYFQNNYIIGGATGLAGYAAARPDRPKNPL